MLSHLKKKNTRKFCDFSSLSQQILLTVVPYICVLLFLGFCWLLDQAFLLGFAFKMVALAEHSRGSVQGAGKARHRTGMVCQGWSSFSREPWPAPGPGEPSFTSAHCLDVGEESDHLCSGAAGLGQAVD